MSTQQYGPDLTLEPRFRGPARSANGGYTAGSLAERLAPGADGMLVEVTLREPPPLDVAMRVRHLAAEDTDNPTGSPLVRLLLHGATVAEARTVEREPFTVEPVPAPTAEAAAAAYPGLTEHPFPGCFACGPERAEGDGLRIFPGPVEGDRMAAVWTPAAGLGEQTPLSDVPDQTPRVGTAVTWASLDCVGGWASALAGRRMVLGRMTAQVDALPAVGEAHVLVSRSLGREGRKTFTASTLYDADERIVARAEHVWIEVDPDKFN